MGPRYGYFPKASKTHIIAKSDELKERARELFDGEGLQITSDGERHIGAVLGSESYRDSFVSEKVQKWVQDVIELSHIAKDEPQVAFSAYNTGLCHRWTFLQRTVRGISHLFLPLEQAICEMLLPALLGGSLSDIQRRIVALPYRMGGLGIKNPVLTADNEYNASRQITADLSRMICEQEMDLTRLDMNSVQQKKIETRVAREALLTTELQDILSMLGDEEKKLLKCAGEKGASSWLSALPLKRYGYSLNKQEFRDAICLRYGWKISEMPIHCGCGSTNSINHLLICKKGGYVTMRHNAIRDVEGKLLREVCTDIKIEPHLLPTNAEQIHGNVADNARLDIAARGVWSRYQQTFMDVRITHPTAASHLHKSASQLYAENEREKKNLYGDRVLHVERGSFVPLVFTTTGGMGPECVRLNKRIAELIARKTSEPYSIVLRHIRTRLRFALLRCTLIAIRGTRGRVVRDEEEEVGNISFNLIPQVQDFN